MKNVYTALIIAIMFLILLVSYLFTLVTMNAISSSNANINNNLKSTVINGSSTNFNKR